MYKSIDLYYYYQIIKYYMIGISNLDFVLTLILLFYTIRLYILVITKISKYIRFEIIKRHLYFSDATSTNKYNKLLIILSLKTIPNVFKWNALFQRLFLFFNIPLDGKNLGLELGIIWANIRYYFHYIFLFNLLMYDIFCNNFMITKIFLILPFIFIYDLWVKLCKFINGLQRFYDMHLYYMIYESENNENLSPEEILKNKRITWTEVFYICLQRFKSKLKEIYMDPLL